MYVVSYSVTKPEFNSCYLHFRQFIFALSLKVQKRTSRLTIFFYKFVSANRSHDEGMAVVKKVSSFFKIRTWINVKWEKLNSSQQTNSWEEEKTLLKLFLIQKFGFIYLRFCYLWIVLYKSKKWPSLIVLQTPLPGRKKSSWHRIIQAWITHHMDWGANSCLPP